MSRTGSPRLAPKSAFRGSAGADRLWTALTAPWAGATWRATAHVLVGGLLGVFTTTVVFALLVTGAALAVTIVVPATALAALLACVRGFTALQRSRFAVFLGEDPVAGRPDHAPWPGPERTGDERRSVLVRAWTTAWTAATWRQVVYHLLAGVVGICGFVSAAFAWCAALVLLSVLLDGWGLPASGPLGMNLHEPAVLAALAVLGVAVLLTAPWVVRACAAVDLGIARALLGPSRREERADLNRRVAGLAESRAALIEAADEERHRIERDLHDGAQQRLVALAMNLGIARSTLDLPAPARAALEQAHDEAKQALTDLREFVRGLHPAVLNDRGLDAALSGLAARSPVPVRLRVDLSRRPSPTVEAVAYFVASEALTNVAKHARASCVEVRVCQYTGRKQSEWLSLAVTDDGCGGACPEGGTGLRGLAHRVASVDGGISITSPPGGPTCITVEMPCA